MTPPPPVDDDAPGADLARSYAALLGSGSWQLDVPDAAAVDSVPPPEPPREEPPPPPSPTRPPVVEGPPPPERIVEALLFVGGAPLTAERAAEVIRGLTAEDVRTMVDGLNDAYRKQGRPYQVQRSEAGYFLTLRPKYRPVRDRLYGGPREARLSQAALDVLAVVAYRQPITKPEVDSLRGAESGSTLKQLVRLGLIAVVRRGEVRARDVAYGTTPRFLELFNLGSLDDLPRTGDWQRL